MSARMAILRRLAMAGMAAGLIFSVSFETVAADAPPPFKGDIAAFEPLAAPEPAPELAFTDAEGKPAALADFRGRLVLLNLWATWCAPCIAEMPALDRLQAELGGRGLQVVALSLDRGGANVVRPFYGKQGLANLGIWLDPKGQAMKTLKPRGLPTTLLIGRDGQVVGRLEGAADWAGPEGRALVEHYLAR